LLDPDHDPSKPVQLLIGGQSAEPACVPWWQTAGQNMLAALDQSFDVEISERGETAKQQARRLRDTRVSSECGT
jgi:hypothetical protein